MSKQDERPLIAVWCEDLYFIIRIESAAESMGADVGWLSADKGLDDEGLIAHVVKQQPALIVIDMNLDGYPWAAWASALKRDERTMGIPLIAFGSHMDVDAMKAAKQAGIEQVLARSRFTSEMSVLLRAALS